MKQKDYQWKRRNITPGGSRNHFYSHYRDDLTRGEIRESAIHRAVEKCEEDYKTKNSLTELPASVIQEYFRLSGNHFQDVERE